MLRLGNRLLLFIFVFGSLSFAQQLDQARRIQAGVLGIDGHNDTAQRVLIEHVDITQRLSSGMLDIPRLREGGVHVHSSRSGFRPITTVRKPFAGLSICVMPCRASSIRILTRLNSLLARAISSASSARKIAAVLTVEGGHQIDDDLAVLRMYRRMGILSMTLTHFRYNDWADSSTSPPMHNGLTDFGNRWFAR